MTDLEFWRDKYKSAPPDFKPIIATLGKLIKLGDNATTNDISPAEMHQLCSAAKINLNFNFDDAKNYRWNIPPHTLKRFSQRILLMLSIHQSKDSFQSISNNFDYAASKADWLEYLREVYRRVEGTGNAQAVRNFGRAVANGVTLDNTELHNALIYIVNNIISHHSDLFNIFAENYLYGLSLETVKSFTDFDFWQAFEFYTGGSLYHAEDPYFLFYFKPDVCNFFKLVYEEGEILNGK